MCHCRIKNLNRGEIGGLNDELQNKRLIISDKDIVFEPQADHSEKGDYLEKVIAFFIFARMAPDEVPVLCRPS